MLFKKYHHIRYFVINELFCLCRELNKTIADFTAPGSEMLDKQKYCPPQHPINAIHKHFPNRYFIFSVTKKLKAMLRTNQLNNYNKVEYNHYSLKLKIKMIPAQRL